MATYYVTTSGSDSNDGLSEGNAWATPGYAAGQMANGDITYIKAGTYTVSVNSANVSNGYINGSVTDAVWRFRGYDTTPGDEAGRPTIAVSISTVTAGLFRTSYSVMSLENIIIDGSGGGSSQIGLVGTIGGNSRAYLRRVSLVGCLVGCGGSGANAGASSGQGITCENCEAIDCNIGFVNCITNSCYAKGCTMGFGTPNNSTPGPAMFCIADSCEIGFGVPGLFGTRQDFYCIAYNSTSHGWSILTSGSRLASSISNCLSIGNGGYAFFDGSTTGNDRHVLERCVDYDNTSGRKAGKFLVDRDPITLTSDPFVNAAGLDFTINDVAGGGAVLKPIISRIIGTTTDYRPFSGWLAELGGGGGGPQRIRQGNLIGRSF